ncbi:MAG TPA: hypothetical protein DCS21_06560 [Gammaproteobacteria bacterium]|nr:hypothetical protein [Gammaproteobacteria bacterium]
MSLERSTVLSIKVLLMRAMVLMGFLGIAACAGSGSMTAGEAEVAPADQSTVVDSESVADEYRIGPQDLLELKVFGVKDLERDVRVSSRGTISLPLIGVIKVAGLTGQELEAELSTRLAKDFLQNPQVSIFIKEYTSQRVTVEGAVKKPGIYPLKGRNTLLQVLATAEGLTSIADPNVKLFRADPATGNRKAMDFDLEKIRTGELRDPEVRNEDVIQVGESMGKATAKQLLEFIVPFRLLAP